MVDDPTTSELDRRIERMERAISDGFKSMNDRLDRLVSSEVFSQYKENNDRRVKAVEDTTQGLEDRQADNDSRFRLAILTAALSLAVTLAGGAILLAATGGIPT